MDFLSNALNFDWFSRGRANSLGTSSFCSWCFSTMGAVNYIATIITLRAPGMGYFDMPLTVWGLWLTAVLNAIFFQY
jgi:heme/copper-type cytochrome/quinol oxidase subunit 1